MKVLEQHKDVTVVELSALEARILATGLVRFNGRPNQVVASAAQELREDFSKYELHPFQSAYPDHNGIVGIPLGVDLTEEYEDDSVETRERRQREQEAERRAAAEENGDDWDDWSFDATCDL